MALYHACACNGCISFYISMQRRGIKKQLQDSKNRENVGITADKKLVFVLCYFVTFCSLYLATSNVNSNYTTQFASLAEKYFACEANGYDINGTCTSVKMAYEALTYPEISMAFLILFGAFPAVTLIFIVRLNKSKRTFNTSISKKQSTFL